MSDDIQQGVVWLLRDLASELRHTQAAALRERALWALKNPGGPQESCHPGR
jgi:hypothetical protein